VFTPCVCLVLLFLFCGIVFRQIFSSNTFIQQKGIQNTLQLDDSIGKREFDTQMTNECTLLFGVAGIWWEDLPSRAL